MDILKAYEIKSEPTLKRFFLFTLQIWLCIPPINSIIISFKF